MDDEGCCRNFGLGVTAAIHAVPLDLGHYVGYYVFNTLKAQADWNRWSRRRIKMVTAIDEDPEERIEKMSMILMKIKDFMMIENPKIDSSLRESYHCFSWAGKFYY
ncbi:hypothetical protein K7X08_019037 [Anisodus acutangulus]|uniref:Uncharacterized protein n=1 Tax=Anisodus acutangulus TaxID=402998 RepID=A0A9Q1M0F3_9SOLA|nr:hypothetical protein K7X08_019037 [Anisodus acutangulus]